MFLKFENYEHLKDFHDPERLQIFKFTKTNINLIIINFQTTQFARFCRYTKKKKLDDMKDKLIKLFCIKLTTN